MNKFRVVFIFLLLAILSVELFFYLSPTKKRVILTDTGFLPASINLRPGDSVIFSTKIEDDFWPASNLHPTHAIYSDFDPGKALSRDSKWEFTFTKPGKWEFHDHLYPQFEGVVNVAGKQKDYCKDVEDGPVKISCWEQEIEEELEKEGVGAAFEVVEDLYLTEPDFSIGCHQTAHIIGEKAYDLYSTNKDVVVSEKANYCGFGFYHGFMEELLRKTGNLDGAREFCHYVDEQLAKTASSVGLACFHGIGHGAVDSHDGRYWGDADAMAKPALELCQKVSGTDDEFYRCASGVFNGIALFYISGDYGLVLDQKDPLALCHRQPTAYQEACYGNFNVVLMWIAEGDFVKAASYFDQIPVKEEIPQAMEYLGNVYAIDLLQKDNFQKEAGECQSFENTLRINCIEGVVGGLIEHGQPGIEYEKALFFCRTFQNQQDYGVCLEHMIGIASHRYSEDKIKSICQQLAENEQWACREKSLL